MTAIVLAVGVVMVLLGFVLCTDRAEAWHRNRRQPKPQPYRQLWILSGCLDCGMNDLPLDLYHRCWVCADLKELKAVGGGR